MKKKKRLLTLGLLAVPLALLPPTAAIVSERYFRAGLELLESRGLSVADVHTQRGYSRSQFSATVNGQPLQTDLEHGLGTFFRGDLLRARSDWGPLHSQSRLGLLGRAEVNLQLSHPQLQGRLRLRQQLLGGEGERFVSGEELNGPGFRLSHFRLRQSANGQNLKLNADRLTLNQTRPPLELNQLESEWRGDDRNQLQLAATVAQPDLFKGEAQRYRLELRPAGDALTRAPNPLALLQTIESVGYRGSYQLDVAEGQLQLRGSLNEALPPARWNLDALVGAELELNPAFVQKHGLYGLLSTDYGGLVLPSNQRRNYLFTLAAAPEDSPFPLRLAAPQP